MNFRPIVRERTIDWWYGWVQNFESSGFSLEPTQRLASASAQSNAVQHSHSVTLNQQRCLPTTSHHMKQPATIFMGRSYHGVSSQEVLHHYPPVTAAGRPVQQHDPKSTGQNYPQPTYASGAESWHWGYSPDRYEVVTLPGNVKKCYGCGAEFTDRHRSPPYNIVVKHVDRRLVRRDERTGNFLFSADYSNTYYQLDFATFNAKIPFSMGRCFFDSDKLSSLDNSRCNILENCNLNVTVIWYIVIGLEVSLKFGPLSQNRQEFHL